MERHDHDFRALVLSGQIPKAVADAAEASENASEKFTLHGAILRLREMGSEVVQNNAVVNMWPTGPTGYYMAELKTACGGSSFRTMHGNPVTHIDIAITRPLEFLSQGDLSQQVFLERRFSLCGSTGPYTFLYKEEVP